MRYEDKIKFEQKLQINSPFTLSACFCNNSLHDTVIMFGMWRCFPNNFSFGFDSPRCFHLVSICKLTPFLNSRSRNAVATISIKQITKKTSPFLTPPIIMQNKKQYRYDRFTTHGHKHHNHSPQCQFEPFSWHYHVDICNGMFKFISILHDAFTSVKKFFRYFLFFTFQRKENLFVMIKRSLSELRK